MKKTDYKFYHASPKQNFKRCKPKAQLPFIYRNTLLSPCSSRCITNPHPASKDSSHLDSSMGTIKVTETLSLGGLL